jgi:hypothetical protein
MFVPLVTWQSEILETLHFSKLICKSYVSRTDYWQHCVAGHEQTLDSVVSGIFQSANRKENRQEEKEGNCRSSRLELIFLNVTARTATWMGGPVVSHQFSHLPHSPLIFMVF